MVFSKCTDGKFSLILWKVVQFFQSSNSLCILLSSPKFFLGSSSAGSCGIHIWLCTCNINSKWSCLLMTIYKLWLNITHLWLIEQHTLSAQRSVRLEDISSCQSSYLCLCIFYKVLHIEQIEYNLKTTAQCWFCNYMPFECCALFCLSSFAQLLRN